MRTPERGDIIALTIALFTVALVSGAALIWRAYLAGLPRPETFAKAYELTLTTYDGNAVHLSDFKNKVVIAYAWASWCPYCGAEIENLAKLKQTYGDKVQILAINRAEPLSVAESYTSQLSNTAGVLFLLDPTDSFFKQIGGYAMPETVFIQPNGTISFHQRGPMQLPQVEKALQAILAK